MQLGFDVEKRTSLERADLSRKGAIDDVIVPLVEHINSQEMWYTTSSCSGRITVYCQDPHNSKKGCRWILVSHVSLKAPEIWSLLYAPGLPPEGYVFFKFEPFIIHVMCKTLEAAQSMLQVAVSSGFRNSGITVGKRDRIMLAVRSTHSLEAPVACNGKLLVDEEYVTHLVELANTKMAENLQRVDRFTKQLTSPDCKKSRKVLEPTKSHPTAQRNVNQQKAAEVTADYMLLTDDILPHLFS